MFEFIKNHPVISTGIGIAIAYGLGKRNGMGICEAYHLDELTKSKTTTFFDTCTKKSITAILKPAVEAATEEVAE